MRRVIRWLERLTPLSESQWIALVAPIIYLALVPIALIFDTSNPAAFEIWILGFITPLTILLCAILFFGPEVAYKYLKKLLGR